MPEDTPKARERKGAKPGRLLFVGGIHGVGKSRLCEEIAIDLGVTHCSAGKLISVNAKEVSDIDRNQELILGSVEKLRQRYDPLLLDGHFAVLTSWGTVERIPTSFFLTLDPIAILVVIAPVTDVARRLRLRDGVAYPPGLLEELQRCETRTAGEVAEVLKIPIMFIRQGTSAVAVTSFIQSSLVFS